MLKLSTGYVYDERALAHVNKDQRVEEHPEIPERIERIYAKLTKKDYLNKMIRIEARSALDSELEYAHTKKHIEFLKSTRTMEKKEIG